MTAIDKDQPQPRRRSWRDKRSARRQQVRRRLVARLGGGLTEAQRGADPMRRQRRSRLTVLARYVSFVLAAIILHSGGVALFLLIAAWDPHVHDPPPVNERIEMRIVDAPPPPVEPAEPVEANPTRNPTVEPKVAKPTPPPADPIDVPKPSTVPPRAPKAQAPEAPRRRVVGLSFESTVVGAGGPAFAVGNTRMGATASTADAPEAVEKLQAAAPNRSASRIPTSGARFTKPKRLGSVEPVYPSLLRAQGVEADVVVTITIAADGSVTDVEVIKGAADESFNAAATEAAKRQTFQAATRDGEAVPYTLKYTYRFRLDEA